MQETSNFEPTIQLWDCFDPIGLILLLGQGALYSNQTGGLMCHHPIVRGAFYPLDQRFRSLIESDLASVAENLWCVWPDAKNDEVFAQAIMCRQQTIEEIDRALHRVFGNWCVRLDPERFDDSEEAWLYVVVDCSGRCTNAPVILENGPGTVKAVLTWVNSD